MLEDDPKILSSFIDITEPNEIVFIHKGNFELVTPEIKFTLDGEIYFAWKPDIGVRFNGTVVAGFKDFGQLANLPKVHVLINGEVIGSFNVTRTNFSSDGSRPTLAGAVSGECIKGDKSVPVQAVKFTVPNLRSFHGNSVKDGNAISRSRIAIQNDTFSVVFDKKRNFKEIKEKLEISGGYGVLYFGEITKKGPGGISHKEIEQLSYQLQVFLTFLNGRRCSAFFLQGIYDGELIWTDYTADLVDEHKFVFSWPPKFSIDGFDELWKQFSRLWADENHRDFLNTAVHWYVAANNTEGFAEGSIIMIQTALELFYNWHLIEGRGLLSGKDAENISASNKIRLVLADIGIDKDFPAGCANLKSLGLEDAPESFVMIRNAIVHSQEEKRKKLNSIPGWAKIEALYLGVWYIELCLLKVLGYNGKYLNRVCNRRSERDEFVPWASTPESNFITQEK